MHARPQQEGEPCAPACRISDMTAYARIRRCMARVGMDRDPLRMQFVRSWCALQRLRNSDACTAVTGAMRVLLQDMDGAAYVAHLRLQIHMVRRRISDFLWADAAL